MELLEYQQLAERTCARLDSLSDDNMHMLMGMSTEVGELTDVFKKNLAYNKDIDWVNVEEELADILWYIVNFATLNQLNLTQAMENNINKLKVRYPEKFSEVLAENRDLVKERATLENRGGRQVELEELIEAAKNEQKHPNY
jgi:NTP pyrophosphatase (non-canonical NTP hydrolase)